MIYEQLFDIALNVDWDGEYGPCSKPKLVDPPLNFGVPGAHFNAQVLRVSRQIRDEATPSFSTV
jgi:hypothetical protein